MQPGAAFLVAIASYFLAKAYILRAAASFYSGGLRVPCLIAKAGPHLLQNVAGRRFLAPAKFRRPPGLA